jgi:hypothetical protein
VEQFAMGADYLAHGGDVDVQKGVDQPIQKLTHLPWTMASKTELQE